MFSVAKSIIHSFSAVIDTMVSVVLQTKFVIRQQAAVSTKKFKSRKKKTEGLQKA